MTGLEKTPRAGLLVERGREQRLRSHLLSGALQGGTALHVAVGENSTGEQNHRDGEYGSDTSGRNELHTVRSTP